ncbi:unnamed protein product [Porites evermanni]|uniref:Cilia- and flagella-associated protein 97 n=1 Tax=Porites evermanni TaxID=104178 RepID=A0ABN8LMS5_9CNID|nr:unnamed protein product [Porites evermanni]
MASAKTHRRNSTGNTCHDRTDDRLKREHFLHPNSDQIDLNLLLQAVLDINEKLNEKQGDTTERKMEDVAETRVKLTSKGYWDDARGVKDFDDTASRHSSVSTASRSRPRSAVNLNESRRPAPLERKNMSFSNTTVDAIDRENQRLLKVITRTRGRPKTAQPKKAVSEPLRVQTSSEVNRYRFQRKVDMENQKLLQRLEAITPTRSLSRDSLLKDHLKQKQYSKTASRSRPSSAKSTTSSVSHFSRSPSESSLMIGDSLSVASSRISSGSRRSVQGRKISRPVWESGW